MGGPHTLRLCMMTVRLKFGLTCELATDHLNLHTIALEIQKLKLRQLTAGLWSHFQHPFWSQDFSYNVLLHTEGLILNI